MANPLKVKVELAGVDEAVANLEAIQPVAAALPESWLLWLLHLAVQDVKVRIGDGRWQPLVLRAEARRES